MAGLTSYGPLDESLYDNFAQLVADSAVDLLAALAWQPDPAADPGDVPATADAVVIDVHPRQHTAFIPDLSADPLNALVLPAISAELVRMDASGAYQPYRATAVPTLANGLARFAGSGADEYLEVEFALRPGLTWHDGQALTADDLVFSWQYVMQPGWPGARLAQNLAGPELYVSSVAALAPDRVVYRFMSEREAHAAARSGGRLGGPTWYHSLAAQRGPVVPLTYPDVGRHVYPEHLLRDIPVAHVAVSAFAQQPVYAGAYRLVAGGPQHTVVLEAFDGFALGPPAIPRIVLGARYRFSAAQLSWQPPDLLAQAMPAQAIHAQLAMPAVNARQGADSRAYDALTADGRIQVAWVPRDGWETLDFNLDNPHLADLRVRQAIAHALDRQAIIDQALAGHGSLMHSYLPTWHPLAAGEAAVPQYAHDPAAARALLSGAGYDLSQTPATHPRRGPLRLRLESMDVAPYARPPIAALIQQQLAAIGIAVQVQFSPWETFEGQDCTAIRNGRRFDLALAGWLGATRRFPGAWVARVTATASIPTPDNGCPYERSNWPGWRNPQADALLAQLSDGRLALSDPQAYQRAWAEHQRLWAEELPSLALFNWHRPVTWVPALSGIAPSPFAFGGVEDTWNIASWRYQAGP